MDSHRPMSHVIKPDLTSSASTTVGNSIASNVNANSSSSCKLNSIRCRYFQKLGLTRPLGLTSHHHQSPLDSDSDLLDSGALRNVFDWHNDPSFQVMNMKIQRHQEQHLMIHHHHHHHHHHHQKKKDFTTASQEHHQDENINPEDKPRRSIRCHTAPSSRSILLSSQPIEIPPPSMDQRFGDDVFHKKSCSQQKTRAGRCNNTSCSLNSMTEQNQEWLKCLQVTSSPGTTSTCKSPDPFRSSTRMRRTVSYDLCTSPPMDDDIDDDDIRSSGTRSECSVAAHQDKEKQNIASRLDVSTAGDELEMMMMMMEDDEGRGNQDDQFQPDRVQFIGVSRRLSNQNDYDDTEFIPPHQLLVQQQQRKDCFAPDRFRHKRVIQM